MTKLGLGLLIGAIVTMLLGRILIGVTKDGFLTLKFFGVGGLLQIDSMDKKFIEADGTNIGLLQFGAVLAAIITPILLISSFGILGFSFWKKQTSNNYEIEEY